MSKILKFKEFNEAIVFDGGNSVFGSNVNKSTYSLTNQYIWSEIQQCFFDENDLKLLLINYVDWCKKNQKEPIEISNIDTKLVDWILLKLKDE